MLYTSLRILFCAELKIQLLVAVLQPRVSLRATIVHKQEEPEHDFTALCT